MRSEVEKSREILQVGNKENIFDACYVYEGDDLPSI
jgi:hypothetical protein